MDMKHASNVDDVIALNIVRCRGRQPTAV